jgi:hypothetical protein
MTNENDFKPKNPRDKPCYLCGKSEFSWGRLSVGETDDENRSRVFFRPMDATFEDGDYAIYVRHCEICGNILMFTVDS